MQRAFFGHGFRPPFRPFRHPFFPGRFLFPFFFFNPFFFPFFRDGEGNDNNMIFAQHHAQAGDSLEKVCHMYNMPYSIMEEANPHIENKKALKHGETVYVPRISHMQCHKTYMEREMPQNTNPGQQQPPWTPFG